MSTNISDKASTLHQKFVDELIKQNHILTKPIEDAFRSVPRHLFLPNVPLEEVYRDQSIPIERADGIPISASSQPAIMANMLEQLQLEPGHRVLEIGAGSGYNAALMAHIVGETGHVVTIDVDENLVANANKHLSAAGFERVQAIYGDGGVGYQSASPFDRIILTVGSWDIAPAWHEQLTASGRLLMPLALKSGVQISVAFEQANNHLVSLSAKPCGFMMLRGTFAGPEYFVQLGPEPGLYLTSDDPSSVDAEAIYRSLTGAHTEQTSSIKVTQDEIFRGLGPWLALHESSFCSLNAQGGWAERGIVPDLINFSSRRKYRSTIGLIRHMNICLLSRSREEPPLTEQTDDKQPFALSIWNFGSENTSTHHLYSQINAWEAAGRPTVESLLVKAYLQDGNSAPSDGKFSIQKRWTHLTFDWL